MERWMMLEERNERLFEILGAIANEAKREPDSTYSVNLVLEILEEIAYGEIGEEVRK